MALEIKLDDRVAHVELLSQDDSHIQIMVDNVAYDCDVIEVEKGVYSVLFKGRSYNVELIESDSAKKYAVNTFYHSYDAEIIDAEAKYLQARGGIDGAVENTIKSPMPGKVVKIPVTLGQQVEKGQTLVIVSAMKMESEYKAMKDGVVSEIFVKENDTVDGGQPLVKIDDIQ